MGKPPCDILFSIIAFCEAGRKRYAGSGNQKRGEILFWVLQIMEKSVKM